MTEQSKLVPDEMTATLSGLGGRQMLAASVRGRAHAQKQGNREDTFRLSVAAGWNLLALADGATPVLLPQQGSNIAVAAALAELELALWEQPDAATVFNWMPEVLLRAAGAARAALDREAARRNLNVRNLDTTLLLLAHYPPADLVAAMCIGDGLVGARVADGRHTQLVAPSNPIRHLTSTAAEYWRTCIKLYNTWESPPVLLLLTSDGLSNDYPAYTDKLTSFLATLEQAGRSGAGALYQAIAYEGGSDDDRTVAMIEGVRSEKLLMVNCS
jgi:hypothetical protein